MNFEVRHSLQGRIRIFLPDLHADPFMSSPLARFLRGRDGITAVRANRYCGSVIVEFNGSQEQSLSFLAHVSWQQLCVLALAAPELKDEDSGPAAIKEGQSQNSFGLFHGFAAAFGNPNTGAADPAFAPADLECVANLEEGMVRAQAREAIKR